MKNKILILEPVLKHWMTVQPIVLLFLQNGWEVSVYSPKFIHQSLNISRFNIQYHNNLILKKDSIINLFILLIFKRHRIIILSNRFLNIKTYSLNIKTYIKIFIEKMIFILFCLIKPLESKLILSSHFVDGLNFKPITSSGILLNYSRFVFKLLYKKISVVNVYSNLVKEKLERQILLPIIVAPAAVFKPVDYNNYDSKNKIKVILPGRIDSRRRYYSWIYNIPPFLKNNYEFILLGKAQTDEDKKWVKIFNDLGYLQPSCSGSMISQDIYDEFMESSDFLFAPLTKLGNSDSSVDRNLGPFYDSIRYGKPLLIPDFSPVDKCIEDNVMKYFDDLNLVEILKSFLNDRNTFGHIVQKAMKNSQRYSLNELTYFNDLTSIIESKN